MFNKYINWELWIICQFVSKYCPVILTIARIESIKLRVVQSAVDVKLIFLMNTLATSFDSPVDMAA